MPAAFTGFPPGAVEFLRGLAAENTKAYFDAHRADYEQQVRLPLEDLADEAQARYGPAKVFRPNRDVRFSKDKSPYKTTASLYAGHPAGVYVSLGVDGLEVGGGLYGPSRDQLARAREVIDEDAKAAAALVAIVAALDAAGLRWAGPGLKTAPRGYAADHPRVELLRLTHYAATRHVPLGPDVHDPERARAAVLGTWEQVEPLLAWLTTHVGPPQHA